MEPSETRSDQIETLRLRIAELEARVRKLEIFRESASTTEDYCPACGGSWILTDERDISLFGGAERKLRELTCKRCDRKITRGFNPSQA